MTDQTTAATDNIQPDLNIQMPFYILFLLILPRSLLLLLSSKYPTAYQYGTQYTGHKPLYFVFFQLFCLLSQNKEIQPEFFWLYLLLICLNISVDTFIILLNVFLQKEYFQRIRFQFQDLTRPEVKF